MRTTLHISTTGAMSPATTTVAATTATAAGLRSPWHSPVPYLFGGLAAMLGLIAFALLILACSYWRLSREDAANNNHVEEERDLESGGKGGDGAAGSKVFEHKVVVIMAGDDMPTFLATPALITLSKPIINANDDHHNNHTTSTTNCAVSEDNGDQESTSSFNGDDDKAKDDDEEEETHSRPMSP